MYIITNKREMSVGVYPVPSGLDGIWFTGWSNTGVCLHFRISPYLMSPKDRAVLVKHLIDELLVHADWLMILDLDQG